jgi:hypothetical protein
MTAEMIGSVEIFFSYDQEDEPLQKKLEKRLQTPSRFLCKD